MVSGEATGLQRDAFRHPCLCNRIKMGYLGLCDLGSQASGPSCHRRCVDSREEILDLSCKASGLRIQDWRRRGTVQGAAERKLPLGSEVRPEEAGKRPYLERGSVDRPLDIQRFLSFKRPCAQLNWKISYTHSFFIRY